MLRRADRLIADLAAAPVRHVAVMLTNRNRLVAVAGSAALGAWLSSSGNVSTGLLLLVASAVLAVGYVRHGPVWLATRALQRGDNRTAASHLSSIAAPQRLGRQSRAYYEMASGVVAADHGRSAEAQQHLRSALELPLRTANDRALVEARLAALLVGTANAEASELLERAAGRSPNAPVKAEIDRVRASLGEAV